MAVITTSVQLVDNGCGGGCERKKASNNVQANESNHNHPTAVAAYAESESDEHEETVLVLMLVCIPAWEREREKDKWALALSSPVRLTNRKSTGISTADAFRRCCLSK